MASLRVENPWLFSALSLRHLPCMAYHPELAEHTALAKPDHPFELELEVISLDTLAPSATCLPLPE